MKRLCVLLGLSSFLLACAAQTINGNQAPAQTGPGMQQMQGRMQNMQAMMDRIRETEDPQERQRLMHEHMQSMQQGMRMMREQGDTPAPGPECAQSDAQCRMQRMQGQQQMMNQRMGMMQMMMEQMMGQMTQRDAKPDESENPEAHH